MNKRRLLSMGAVAFAAMALLVACNTNSQSDGKRQILAAAGSDTTQDVMRVVLQNFQNDTGVNPNGEDVTVNIPAVPTSGVTVPAEPAGTGTGTCEARTYVAAGSPPSSYTAPNGSGAGKNALKDPANLPSTCIDIARSSSGPNSATDPATFEYYAYARDAVSWSAFGYGRAPGTLTKQQIKDIYACNVTNWAQVGGQNSPITRYLPQVGSGTRAFFLANILDGQLPSETCGPVKLIEENKADQIPEADKYNSIEPYSSAQWIAQKNGVITDHTAVLAQIRSIRTSAGDENPAVGPDANGKFAPNAAVVNGGTFPGVRYVYNVLDTRLPSYTSAVRVVGFTSNSQSSLCSGGESSVLQQYGFTPLPTVNGVSCILQRP